MNNTTSEKTYHSKFRNANLIGAIVSLLVSIPLFISYFFSLRLIDFSIALITLSNCIIQYGMTRTRMIVSPNGITYHHLGLYSFHSSWDNIEGVNYVHFRIFGSQRCLILKQGKKLSKISELDWTISNNDREQIIPIPELTTPIELMDDIKKYAPTIYGLR